MKWCSFGATRKHSDRVLEKYLATPLEPMNLRNMSLGGKRQIRSAVEQLGARTARSYLAFSSDIIRRSLDRETSSRILNLESICKREFECCVALSEAAELYLNQLERGEICEIDTPQPNELSDDVSVDNIMKGNLSNIESSGTRFIDALEDLRPHENMLDIVVNEKCIRSEDLNKWISCFCRRRVSWRVIHEHLLHLVGPKRHPPIIRVDKGIGHILQHTGTVVIELYSRVVQPTHGGSITIKVEEQSDLLTKTPAGKMTTSSATVAPVMPAGVDTHAPPSPLMYSVEGHLEYVIRELIKNACVAMLPRVRDITLHVRFSSNETHVVVDVEDTAGGLRQETVEKLWLFGWSTNTVLSNPMSGFGVGLPASKVYMDLWGGKIDLYTELGTGTTARVTFPKAPTEIFLPSGDIPPLA